MSREEILFEPHSQKQFDAIDSDADITVIGTGIQWGKTLSGSLWMKRQCLTYTDKADNFLVTSPTYKTLQQSTLPPLLEALKGWGTYNKTDAHFRLHTGANLWIRTGTEPDSVVGIPNVRAIWGDEAGKYSLYFHENIEARAAPKDARILYTTSPYSLNWLWKDLIKPHMDGLRPDVRYIKANSSENPYFNKEVYEKRRQTMDPRRFAMLYGGEFGRMSGLVYDCWSDSENTVSPFELPTGTKYFGGIDWGYFPDPFVMKIRAITPDGRHYGINEYVRTQMGIMDIVALLKQKRQLFPIIRFYCDPSNPGHIAELNKNGIPAEGADNSIRTGIDLHYELIKIRKYKEFTGHCPHSNSERESYHYPEPKDLKPDQASKELLPVDQDNHTMDVDRYLTMMTYRSQIKTAPKSPEDAPKLKPRDQIERLQSLKKRKSSRGHETWS